MYTKLTLISGLLATNALAYNGVSEGRTRALVVTIAALVAVPKAVNGAPLSDAPKSLTKRHGPADHDTPASAEGPAAVMNVQAEGKS